MTVSETHLGRPLRFGVMCSQAGLSGFARECIEHILRDGLAELKLVILDAQVPRPSSAREKIVKALRLQGNLWHLQSKLFPHDDLPAWRAEPFDNWLAPPKQISCEPVLKGKWSQYFKPEDIAAIEAEQLDFILKFGFGIIRGAVLHSARLGVWSYHHADEERYRAPAISAWIRTSTFCRIVSLDRKSVV